MLVQTAVLASLIGFRQWTLNTGTPVVLAIHPVDPRSLFQGDYVQLSYEIGNLRSTGWLATTIWSGGRRCSSIFSRAGRRGRRRGSGVSVLWRLRRGRCCAAGSSGCAEQQCEESGTGESTAIVPCRIAHIRYGIESYFVPEGMGRELERPTEGERIDIRVAVNRAGTPAISAILVNGQPRVEEGLF